MSTRQDDDLRDHLLSRGVDDRHGVGGRLFRSLIDDVELTSVGQSEKLDQAGPQRDFGDDTPAWGVGHGYAVLVAQGNVAVASIRGEADLDRSLADGHARDLCQVLFARGCGGLIDVASWGEGSAGYYHHIVEAVKIAFADRDEWLSDSSFVDISLQKLLSKHYADERRALIDPARALPIGGVEPGLRYGPAADRRPADGDTVYFCATDGDGLVVSNVQLIYHDFGSAVSPATPAC